MVLVWSWLSHIVLFVVVRHRHALNLFAAGLLVRFLVALLMWLLVALLVAAACRRASMLPTVGYAT